jgi:thymidylate synthase
MTFEAQYLELIRRVIDTGDRRGNRTGTPARSVFGETLKIDLAAEFPILQVRPVSWKAAIRELLWMIRGESYVQSLQAQGVHIWDAWADENGDLGPVYGAQWRTWTKCNGDYVDQLADVIRAIHRDPTSRRLVVSAWNVGELDKMALPPCHMMFQFYVRSGQYLDCQMYQRSADLCVGTPFNAIGYATLTQMIAQETGLLPGKLTIVMGDAHVYEGQVELAEQMLARYDAERRGVICKDQPPQLKYWKIPGEFFAATIEDFDVENYQPYGPAIKWPVAK